MPIFTGCPSCWTTLKIPDRLAGKRVKCGQCGTVLQVPEAEISPSEPLPEGVDRAAAVKRCWACGGEVLKEAQNCYHCGVPLENASADAS